MTRSALLAGLLLLGSAQATVSAQTSSIGAKHRKAQAGKPAAKPAREVRLRDVNLAYERHAWTAIKPAAPKTFRPGDLITIIVRHRRLYEADSELQARKKYNLTTELDAFLKPTQGGIGAANFRRGKPNIAYKLDQRLTSTGDSSREDRLTTRVAAKIIDVKPNGVLVLEGRSRIVHDDEVSVLCVMGSCRKEDVTADNTILSTQMAGLELLVDNQGALRAASSRGWLHKLVDAVNPF